MWQILFLSIGLVFVIEGLLPFLLPHIWRHMMQQMITQSDRTLRVFGLISMLIGLAILYLSS